MNEIKLLMLDQGSVTKYNTPYERRSWAWVLIEITREVITSLLNQIIHM